MDAGEKLLAAIEALVVEVRGMRGDLREMSERLPPLTPAQRMARLRERKKAEEAARYAETPSPVTQLSEGNVTEKLRNAVTQPLPSPLPPPSPSPAPPSLPLFIPPSLSKKALSSAEAPDDVLAVFYEWQRVMGKPTAKLTPKRRAHVAARLREGYGVERLISAIHGCKRSPFHQGQNEQGSKYDDLELICRNGGQVEKFEARCPQPPAAPAHKPKTAQEIEAEASAEFEREWRLKNG